MNNIDNEIQNIKTDYGDKITMCVRQRLDKYSLILKQIGKISLTKTKTNNPSPKMLKIIINELIVLRRQIEGELKIHYTDYEAFLWKLEHLKNETKPLFFHYLTIQKPKLDFNIVQAKTNINLPILEMKTKDLLQVGCQLIQQNKFCKENFDQKFISKLIRTISQKYNINSYHNFSHAFSVFLLFLQCTELSPSIGQMFSDLQIFVGFIAALCHDMNHKGTNSMYEIKKKSELSMDYNNESVLENMHISEFYRMNKQNPDIDIIRNIKSPAQKVTAKMLFNSLILATDVTGHHSNLSKVVLLKGKNHKQFTSSDKRVVLQNLFHACDIGNPILEFNNYMNWSMLLAHQFDQQAEQQKLNQFEVSPNFVWENIKTHYSRQIGFIDFLAYPLWKQMSIIYPELEVLVEEILKNRKKLEVEKN